MNVFVLLRENQNEHGYIDTSIDGVFDDECEARAAELRERRKALEQGLIVENDDSPGGEWQVSWMVEEHVVR